jgi:hypothetical protein
VKNLICTDRLAVVCFPLQPKLDAWPLAGSDNDIAGGGNDENADDEDIAGGGIDIAGGGNDDADDEAIDCRRRQCRCRQC